MIQCSTAVNEYKFKTKNLSNPRNFKSYNMFSNGTDVSYLSWWENMTLKFSRKNVMGHTLLHAWVLCVFVCLLMACVRKCVSFCDNGLSNITMSFTQKENGTSVL